jgi:hypothetical protein
MSNQAIVLTLTIPVDGSGVVDIVGQKGDVAKMWQVAYGDQADLAAAIHTAAWELVNLEIAPPPRYDPPAMPGKKPAATHAEKIAAEKKLNPDSLAKFNEAGEPIEGSPATDEEPDQAPDAGLEDEIRETGEATDAFLESEDEGPEPEEVFEDEDPLEAEPTDG